MLVLQEKWDSLRELVQNMAASTKVSTQPAIYGQLAAADVLRLKVEVQPSGLTTGACCICRHCAYQIGWTDSKCCHACMHQPATGWAIEEAYKQMRLCPRMGMLQP